MSLGKPCQLTGHTNNIESVKAKELHETVETLERGQNVSHELEQRKRNDVLDKMQNHLKQMEQELAIVGEESKELQQRLIIRQQDFEKKV